MGSDYGSVVVTGSSTGIGAASAIHLAEQGFHVFAGVRRTADGDSLQARSPSKVTPLLLDITDEATISAAVDTVANGVGERGLAGLVNNAGIVKPGPLEFQPLADVRMQLEVNLIAHVAAIQAFLPLIRLGRGRIVNVGSIGGRMALPIHGAYSASKFAMEGLSDALRLELRQWGIAVSLVDPGATDTAVFGKTLAEIDNLEETLGKRGYELYAEQIAAIRRLVERTAADTAPAKVLAQSVAAALMSSKPKARYLAGKGARKTAALARLLPDAAKDRTIASEVGLPAPDSVDAEVSRGVV